MNCTLHFIHHAIREADSYIDKHRHPMFEIVYYRNGEGVTEFNRQQFNYEPSTFAVLYPNELHDELRVTDTEVVYFGFYYDNQPVRLEMGLYRDDELRIYALIEQMLEEMTEKLNHHEVKMDSLLQALIVEVQRLSGAKIAQYADRKIAYAKHYMEQYYSEKINLTQLSEICGYSYDHFRHLFKATEGMTPMLYLRQLRIEKAKAMILEREQSLTGIALECGFTSLSQFSSVFRQVTGQNPTNFKLEATYHLPDLKIKRQTVYGRIKRE